MTTRSAAKYIIHIIHAGNQGGMWLYWKQENQKEWGQKKDRTLEDIYILTHLLLVSNDIIDWHNWLKRRIRDVSGSESRQVLG